MVTERPKITGDGVATAEAQGGDAAIRGVANRAIDPADKHLSTHHLLGDLKERTVSGTFITLIAQGVKFVLNLTSVMVLARLLSPKDFGLVAMVSTVIGYLSVFKDAGLSAATVQREGITQGQVSNLFWINVFMSGAVGLALAAGSPLIAWFYREPRLIPITLILASSFLFSGLTMQHTALLNRQMRFKTIAWIQVGSMLSGVIFSVGTACFTHSYWALIVGNVATVLSTVLLTWFAIPWWPHLPSRRAGIRQLVTFGANLATGSFIYSLAGGADAMLVGRVYGSTSVGLYTRAAALLNRPMEQFLSPLNAVFVPVLSRVHAEPARYRRTFLRVYEAMSLASCLATGLLLALARPLMLVVLGPKWEQATLIFAGFTVAAICFPPASASMWLFSSQGRGRDFLVSSSLHSSVALAAFVAGLPFGPAGVAIVYSVAGLLIGLPVLYYFAGRHGPVTTADLWIGFLRYVPLWAVVCSTAYVMRLLFGTFSPLLQVIISAPVGLMAGVILICILPHPRRLALGLISDIQEQEFVRSKFQILR